MTHNEVSHVMCMSKLFIYVFDDSSFHLSQRITVCRSLSRSPDPLTFRT